MEDRAVCVDRRVEDAGAGSRTSGTGIDGGGAGLDAHRGDELSQGACMLALPDGLSSREAQLILRIVARVKARGFGRLTVSVSDGRVVDVEIIEKMDRRALDGL
jgi:hypothetical protein